MSTTDIKRDMTSETMVNFLFNVDASHAISLTLVIYRTGWQDKDSEDSALSNMQIATLYQYDNYSYCSSNHIL